MVQPYLCLITLKWMCLCFPSGPLHHHWKSSEGRERHSFKLESVETAVSNLYSVVPRETEDVYPGITSRQWLPTCQLSCSFVYWLTLSPHPPQFDPIGFQAAVNENLSISCLFHDCHPSVWAMNSQEKNIGAGLRQLAFIFMRHQENENCSTCEGAALKGTLFNRIERCITITAVETREVSLGEPLTFSRRLFSRESSFLRALPNSLN